MNQSRSSGGINEKSSEQGGILGSTLGSALNVVITKYLDCSQDDIACNASGILKTVSSILIYDGRYQEFCGEIDKLSKRNELVFFQDCFRKEFQQKAVIKFLDESYESEHNKKKKIISQNISKFIISSIEAFFAFFNTQVVYNGQKNANATNCKSYPALVNKFTNFLKDENFCEINNECKFDEYIKFIYKIFYNEYLKFDEYSKAIKDVSECFTCLNNACKLLDIALPSDIVESYNAIRKHLNELNANRPVKQVMNNFKLTFKKTTNETSFEIDLNEIDEKLTKVFISTNDSYTTKVAVINDKILELYNKIVNFTSTLTKIQTIAKNAQDFLNYLNIFGSFTACDGNKIHFKQLNDYVDDLKEICSKKKRQIDSTEYKLEWDSYNEISKKLLCIIDDKSDFEKKLNDISLSWSLKNLARAIVKTKILSITSEQQLQDNKSVILEALNILIDSMGLAKAEGSVINQMDSLVNISESSKAILNSSCRCVNYEYLSEEITKIELLISDGGNGFIYNCQKLLKNKIWESFEHDSGLNKKWSNNISAMLDLCSDKDIEQAIKAVCKDSLKIIFGKIRINIDAKLGIFKNAHGGVIAIKNLSSLGNYRLIYYDKLEDLKHINQLISDIINNTNGPIDEYLNNLNNLINSDQINILINADSNGLIKFNITHIKKYIKLYNQSDINQVLRKDKINELLVSTKHHIDCFITIIDIHSTVESVNSTAQEINPTIRDVHSKFISLKKNIPFIFFISLFILGILFNIISSLMIHCAGSGFNVFFIVGVILSASAIIFGLIAIGQAKSVDESHMKKKNLCIFASVGVVIASCVSFAFCFTKFFSVDISVISNVEFPIKNISFEASIVLLITCCVAFLFFWIYGLKCCCIKNTTTLDIQEDAASNTESIDVSSSDSLDNVQTDDDHDSVHDQDCSNYNVSTNVEDPNLLANDQIVSNI